MDTPIPDSVPLGELLRLSTLEKIALIGVLWDSIEEGEVLPVPDWQLEELDRRAAADAANPEASIPWEEVQQRIRSAHRK